MNKEDADRILENYLAGKAAKEEVALVEHWYLKTSNLHTLADRDDFEHLKDELWLGTKKRAGLLRLNNHVQNIWPRMAGAAALFLMLSIGIWFISTRNHGNDAIKVVVNNTAPGKNAATLAFDNGETITLNDTKKGLVVTSANLSYNDGSPLGDHPEFYQGNSIQEEGTQMTASTPRGGTYQITLPDGTRVWLNAESKLSFPSKFGTSARKVQLIGEAYFEVAKVAHKNIPFFVVTRNQEVEVLGTHFNINSYADEGSIKTTLLEGSVKLSSISSPGKAAQIILKPGQQSVLSENSGFKVTKTDVELAIAWKKGLFYFKDADLKTILRTFSRWYDIDVVSTDHMTEKKFSGKLYRDVNVYQALEVLNLLGVDFNIEKNHTK